VNGVDAAESSPAVVPPPASLTHQHLLAVINSEWSRLGGDRPISIVDAGCGFGELMDYLRVALQALHRDSIDVRGFDVSDSSVQTSLFPAIAAKHAIPTIHACDPWPFASGSVDIVVSNQVLEHVADHEHFFAETARVLRDGGFAAHLFPLKHTIVEGHITLPFAHRIVSHDVRESYIRLLSRLPGTRFRYRSHIPNYPTLTVQEYGERHADYLRLYTNYKTQREIMAIAKRAGLRASFRYTDRYYLAKLRLMAGISACLTYRRTPVRDSLATLVLRYLSSVTLFLEKADSYRSWEREREQIAAMNTGTETATGNP
jgi:SAM-dependent methyltransferase